MQNNRRNQLYTVVLAVLLTCFFVNNSYSSTTHQTSGSNQSVNTTDDVIFNTITVTSYENHIQMPANSSMQGATPTTTCQVGTASGLVFDNNNDETYPTMEVPHDWDGISDLTVKFVWFPMTAMSDTETVEIEWEFRSLGLTELITNGTVQTGTETYTSSGATAQYNEVHTEWVLDYDNANQPVTAGDHIYFKGYRDQTSDTYSGDVCYLLVEIVYNSTGLSTAH